LVINVLIIPNDVFNCNENTCPIYFLKRGASHFNATNYYFLPVLFELETPGFERYCYTNLICFCFQTLEFLRKGCLQATEAKGKCIISYALICGGTESTGCGRNNSHILKVNKSQT